MNASHKVLHDKLEGTMGILGKAPGLNIMLKTERNGCYFHIEVKKSDCLFSMGLSAKP